MTWTDVKGKKIHSLLLPGYSAAFSKQFDAPVLPSPWRVPRRFAEGAQPHYCMCHGEKYGQAYFKASDNASC